jgi:hypothetical protein
MGPHVCELLSVLLWCEFRDVIHILKALPRVKLKVMNRLDEQKSKHAGLPQQNGFWLNKMVLAQHFPTKWLKSPIG